MRDVPASLAVSGGCSEYGEGVKTNPFPWFPWWPKVEESHYVPIIVIALVLAAVLIYFSGI
jgi:hypothetical protein